MMSIGNIFVGWLLRTPLHCLLSNGILLLEVTGFRTGKIYRFPVNYQRVGDRLLVVSQVRRTWWRNLRNGAELVAWWRGQRWCCQGQVLEESSALRPVFVDYLARSPGLASVYQLTIEQEGKIKSEDLDRFVQERVAIWITPQTQMV